MKILHIDDSPEICQLYADMFSTENHDFESVNDGREALEMVLKNSYDLILLDLCMPKFGGMEFLSDLKKLNPLKLKKIVVTTVLQFSESQREELMEFGIHSVEEKPRSIQKLETIQKSMWIRQ